MQQFRSIHYLRAVAAIMVAIFHIFNSVAFMPKGLPHVDWMRGGVDIFFVISGFVMVRSTSAKSISPGRFMIRRAQRIVPLYWVASFAAMMQIQGQWSLKIQSLLFIPAMNPKSNMMQPVLEPGWTLNYEMFFYAIFAISLLLRETRRFLFVSIIIISLIVLGQIVEGGALFEFYSRPIIVEFVLGMAIAKFGLRLPIVAVPIGFLMMVVLQPMAVDRIYSLGIPATLIVAGALSAEKGLPAWKLADMLGSASYAIYLFHLLALSLVVKIWSYVDWGNGAFAIVGFGVILFSGCGIYLALEKPILAFFSSLRVKHKTTGAAAKCGPSTQHSQP